MDVEYTHSYTIQNTPVRTKNNYVIATHQNNNLTPNMTSHHIRVQHSTVLFYNLSSIVFEKLMDGGIVHSNLS